MLRVRCFPMNAVVRLLISHCAWPKALTRYHILSPPELRLGQPATDKKQPDIQKKYQIWKIQLLPTFP